MATSYRIIFQTYDDESPNKVMSEKELISDAITVPTDCFNFSMEYKDQISLVQLVQDCVLDEKSKLINWRAFKTKGKPYNS